MREIVLDCETTGMEPAAGDRMVELAALELVNQIPTKNSFHSYFDPERDMPRQAFEVHGLSREFLLGKALFHEKAQIFLDFIGDSPLIIHNAPFDMGFLNHELKSAGFAPLPPDRAVDTLAIARGKFPGQSNSLDALCDRFGIDRTSREKHGALIDTYLLSEVYLELRGGRQRNLWQEASGAKGPSQTGKDSAKLSPGREPRAPRPHQPSEEEREKHRAFVAELKNPLWHIAEPESKNKVGDGNEQI